MTRESVSLDSKLEDLHSFLSEMKNQTSGHPDFLLVNHLERLIKLYDYQDELPRLWGGIVYRLLGNYHEEWTHNLDIAFNPPLPLYDFNGLSRFPIEGHPLEAIPEVFGIYKEFYRAFNDIKKKEKKSKNQIRKKMNPQQIRELVDCFKRHCDIKMAHSFSHQRGDSHTRVMDWILGLAGTDVDNSAYPKLTDPKYEGEEIFYQPTSYAYIQDFIDSLDPTKDDVIYDLGSGLGRVCIYGALTTEAQFKGIELVTERVEGATRIKDRYKIDNLEFIQGNVLDKDYSDGDIFFLFNPFSKPTLEIVGQKLQEISRDKPITVVAWANCVFYFDSLPWLERNLRDNQTSIRIYNSIDDVL